MADLWSGGPGSPADELRHVGHVRDAMAVAGAMVNDDYALAFRMIDGADSHEDMAKGLATVVRFLVATYVPCECADCRLTAWRGFAAVINEWASATENRCRAQLGGSGS